MDLYAGHFMPCFSAAPCGTNMPSPTSKRAVHFSPTSAASHFCTLSCVACEPIRSIILALQSSNVPAMGLCGTSSHAASASHHKEIQMEKICPREISVGTHTQITVSLPTILIYQQSLVERRYALAFHPFAPHVHWS